jgi:hypothetical protein
MGGLITQEELLEESIALSAKGTPLDPAVLKSVSSVIAYRDSSEIRTTDPVPVDYERYIELTRLSLSDNVDDTDEFKDAVHSGEVSSLSDGSADGGPAGKLMENYHKLVRGKQVNVNQGRGYVAILKDGAEVVGGSEIGRTDPEAVRVNRLGREFDEAIAFEREKNKGVELSSIQMSEVMETLLFVNREKQWFRFGDADKESRNVAFDGDITSIDFELVKSVDDIPWQVERDIRSKIHAAGEVPTAEGMMDMWKALYENAAEAKENAEEAEALEAVQEAIATHAPGQSQ